jgi:hypothetical protein
MSVAYPHADCGSDRPKIAVGHEGQLSAKAEVCYGSDTGRSRRVPSVRFSPLWVAKRDEGVYRLHSLT